MQLSCLAGQERDNLLNDSGFANPRVENETREMNLKPTSSPVKRYSPNVKVVKGATTIPLPSQFDEGLEALDAKVKSMMEKCNYMVQSGKIKTTAYICKVCRREGHPSSIRNHIESNHLEGISIPCTFCHSGPGYKQVQDRDKRINHKDIV